jgi:hypothetical protein
MAYELMLSYARSELFAIASFFLDISAQGRYDIEKYLTSSVNISSPKIYPRI